MSALHVLASKQKVGRELTDKIMLPIYIHLDACKRAQGTSNAANQLTKCVVMLLVVGSVEKRAGRSPLLHSIAEKAYKALDKACLRPDPVSFTTGEYLAIRSAVNAFDRCLPMLELKDLTQAFRLMRKSLKIEEIDDPLYVE